MDTYIWNRSARLREIEELKSSLKTVEPKRDQTCREMDEARAERDQALVVLSAAGTWHRQVQGKFLREALELGRALVNVGKFLQTKRLPLDRFVEFIRREMKRADGDEMTKEVAERKEMGASNYQWEKQMETKRMHVAQDERAGQAQRRRDRGFER